MTLFPPTLRTTAVVISALLTALIGTPALSGQSAESVRRVASTHPDGWRADYDRFLAAQSVDRSSAGAASGRQGAVAVAYNGLAARAGLEAMKQGGNAIDAALTAAVTQVALTAGAPISYFGILSLVYYDAESGEVVTMNAEWNTVLAETEPLTIPGGIDMNSEGLYGRDPSGRTALVGGFMKGVGAAHARYGALPFADLFAPAIFVAEQGMPISEKMAGYWDARAADLERLEETRRTMLKDDGSPYVAGDLFRQPALAATLRRVAAEGVDVMYTGAWAERAVAAIQADGGRMTLEDLARYDVIWSDALRAPLSDGWEVTTNPPPNAGGVALVEAHQLAVASGLAHGPHWTLSADSLRKALDITQLYALDYLPDAMRASLFPGLEFSPESRVTAEHAEALWAQIADGSPLGRWKPDVGPKHSDDVVAVDAQGNIAAITHSINSVLWGKTALVVDGITIGDPASFQQPQIARLEPGSRLPAPTETGILFRDGEPVVGFASMGSGLHQRTFQALLNVVHYGLTIAEAIDAPDFFMPAIDPGSLQAVVRVPLGRFSPAVLSGLGVEVEEIDPKSARFGGEGIWVAVARDPETGELSAASHNRNNSAAVAW